MRPWKEVFPQMLGMAMLKTSQSTYYSTALPLPPAYVNKPKALVTTNSNHVVITNNIHVNRINGDVGGVNSWDFFLWSQYSMYY
jgi:hypothetical protein